MTKRMTKTRALVVTAMLAALSAVLMIIEVPMPFIAPSFYKLDLSEVPVLIGSFSMGPIAGVVIEAIKILVKVIIKGTQTGGVGELANFVIGCSLVVPASFMYKYKRTKLMAVIGMAVSTVIMAIMGVVLNAHLLLPAYSAFMPIDQIVQMGKDIFSAVKDPVTFCIFCVAPFNLVKGVIVSVITTLIYKPLSRIIHPKD